MSVQRVTYAVPIEISPVGCFSFARASLVSGIAIQPFSGRLAEDIERRVKSFPEQPSFTPTHLLVIDQETYLAALDSRLAKEGRARPAGLHELIDIRGISRQVLLAITLIGRSTWQVGGYHCFDYSGPGFPHSSAGYSHAQTERVSDLLRWSAPSDWYRNIGPTALRITTVQLDRYYRTGTWEVDRLSVALGYLWSALTTTHPELSFTALCMALEAIATSADTEITHILAERCALLARTSIRERQVVYAEIKSLYALRSKIVHGRSGLKKGPVTWETLMISAKQSIVPRTQVFKLLSIVVDVITGVISSRRLLEILHTKQSDNAQTKAIDEYFQQLLFR